MDDMRDNNENIEEIVNDENTDETYYAKPEDYKLIMDLIEETREQYKNLKTFYEDYVSKTYHLDPHILNGILPVTKEKIAEMSVEDMAAFIEKYSSISLNDFIERQKAVNEFMNTNESGESQLFDIEDAYRKILTDIKSSSMTIYIQKRELDKMIAQSNEILNEYSSYMSSNKVKEARLKYLDTLKETVKKESDIVQKKKMEKMINDIESSYNLSFIFTRLNTLGKKEIDSIVEAFFSNRKGKYIIDKFNIKIVKFGFKPTIFQHFLHLEETFLPEEYHPYNNLFLFIYMRMVAYADPYNKTDKMWVQSITANISDLIYHRFEDVETEQKFKDIMMKVLDNFKDAYSTFYTDNETWEMHSARKDADEKREKSRKEILINKMDELGITGYKVSSSADELQRYFEEKVNELIDQQADDYESELVENEDMIKLDPLDGDTEDTDELPVVTGQLRLGDDDSLQLIENRTTTESATVEVTIGEDTPSSDDMVIPVID